MSFSIFNISTWWCCKLLMASNKKCISILGATFLLFPFSYYVYRFLKSPSEEKFEGENQGNQSDEAMKSMVNSFPIIYNYDKTINVITIKKIYYLAVVFCQEELGSIRGKILLLRRKFFYNVEKYIELTLLLYNEYHRILENSLMKILSLRQIPQKTFQDSVIVNERKQFLRKNFMRDAAWSILSESLGNPAKMNREKMKGYILMQIQDIKIQKVVCKDFLYDKDASIRMIILSSRVDDLAYQRTGLDDLDYVKCLRFYVHDEEVKKLIEERNFLLGQV